MKFRDPLGPKVFVITIKNHLGQIRSVYFWNVQNCTIVQNL